MGTEELRAILKKKNVLVIFLLELLLLMAGIAGLFGPEETMHVSSGEDRICLKAGTYDVEIDYYASGEGCSFSIGDENPDGSSSILFNGFQLESGDNLEKSQLWVLHTTEWAKVDVSSEKGAEIDVRSIELRSTHAGSRIWIFLMLGVITLTVLVNCFVQYDRKNHIPMKRKALWGVLGLVTILISVPSLTDYNIWGHDWGFHLLRVEGLLSGWKDGQFPVRIQGNWIKGFGYAVSIFYSDVFLIVPALFRLIGFTVAASNNLFQIVINIATVTAAYKSLKRCFHDEMTAAAGTVAYVTAAYRVYDVYMRAALGEVLAMVFLPLVFCGFYCVFTEDINDRNYKKNWIMLTAGLTGIIHSHVLTCEMLLVVLIPLCVVLWKRVFRRETFSVLVKAAAMTVLVNSWYLVPFLDFFFTGDFHVSHMDTLRFTDIQEWGTMPSHLLFLFYGRGANAHATNSTMYEAGGFGTGAVLLGAVFVWGWLEFTGRSRRLCAEAKWPGRILFWMCLFLFMLSSCYFPWRSIQSMGGAAEKLVLSLQFPYRFLSLSCIASALLLCILVKNHGAFSRELKTDSIVFIIIFSACAFVSYQTGQMLMHHGFARVYEGQGMGTMDVGNGEYLPYRTDIWQFTPNTLKCSEGAAAEDLRKEQDSLHAAFYAVSTGADSYVEVPLLYYDGYMAVDMGTGEKLAVTAGENNAVRVVLPEGYSGRIEVFFQEFWYWRAAELISLMTMAWLLVQHWRDRRRTEVENVG